MTDCLYNFAFPIHQLARVEHVLRFEAQRIPLLLIFKLNAKEESDREDRLLRGRSDRAVACRPRKAVS